MRLALAVCAIVLLPALSAPTTAPGDWRLVWSDDFSGAKGSRPDPSHWTYDLGAGGWGNGELETYTASPANAFQDGQGHLVIRALRDANGNYTSARLKTEGIAAFTYGKIEVRAKLPYALGVWPAFWMLGVDKPKIDWPRCGEVDIMENFGAALQQAAINSGTIHGPVDASNAPHDYPPFGIGAQFHFPAGQTVYGDYHVYGIEWAKDSIEFFVDGVSYEKLTPASLPPGAVWPFNAPFYLLLNVAISGPHSPFGTPDAHVSFPQDMLVDYVRVYQSAGAGRVSYNVSQHPR